MSELAIPRLATRADDHPVPFLRLIQVELRKLANTRAGRWLLATIALVTLAIPAILFVVDGGEHAYSAYVLRTSTPLIILLPIVGILAATAEWSLRIGLATFTLEPRRGLSSPPRWAPRSSLPLPRSWPHS